MKQRIWNQRACLSLLAVSIMLSACGTFKGHTGKGGGYYQDDGPPKGAEWRKIQQVPDATPQNLPLSKTGNAPYIVFGKRYVPLKRGITYQKQGVASWYGKKYHGRKTSSGEQYDMYAMTAAHPTLPLPSFVQVTNLDNQRQVIVKVNDRGPFLNNRLIDLSYAAAAKLGIIATGTGRVQVSLLNPNSYQAASTMQDTARAVTPALGVSAKPLQDNSFVSIIRPVASQSKSNLPSVTPNKQVSLMLQVAAFSNQQNAINVQHKLLNNGLIEPVVETTQRGNRVLYRVLVGPYVASQIDSAKQTLVELGFNAIVVKRPL